MFNVLDTLFYGTASRALLSGGIQVTYQECNIGQRLVPLGHVQRGHGSN
jgi:hypothetical protein